MGVNITTKYYEGPITLSSRINSNENQRIIKIIYLKNKLYTNYEIRIQMKLYTTWIKIKHTDCSYYNILQSYVNQVYVLSKDKNYIQFNQ